MQSELVVTFVMIAFDRRVLDRAARRQSPFKSVGLARDQLHQQVVRSTR